MRRAPLVAASSAKPEPPAAVDTVEPYPKAAATLVETLNAAAPAPAPQEPQALGCKPQVSTPAHGPRYMWRVWGSGRKSGRLACCMFPPICLSAPTAPASSGSATGQYGVTKGDPVPPICLYFFFFPL